ncbi:MAG: hypothetical protein WED04_11490 [Promethearchaeati archaeon SRVP18_Atabeyarchaeia-1]
MAKKAPKESWISIDWKNRDDTRFENLTPDIRDVINQHIFNGFIGEKGGKGTNISNHVHLEFTKMPSKKETEAWEHRTRFRSVLAKAIVEIDAEEVRVIYVDSAEIKDDTLVIKGNKDAWKYTLYIIPSEFKVAYELYEGSPYERVDTGLLRFASREQIERRFGHYEMVDKDKDMKEATFEVKPANTGKVSSVVFEDDVLVYSKQLKAPLEINAQASQNQIRTYGTP